ncbi:amphi-Trp domain-containing protein [Natronobacterium texcoconense]|uniref:Amphi-Trp domain-containing protein n=1 Tax=Natronobacterium texcoconense TaxID=1095778 RepID=A0A1H0Z9B0_NATTX|nr:amphi-Trp domain-containing protein [Natronobacterium texcoconense]SDQ23706.1 amphi-Trp domain-containing protein [Natronobacterium texcoconense]
MADRTTADVTLSRDELAAYFEHLGEEFREGEVGDGEEVRVSVGNKTVALNPPETVDLSVDVVERSPMFRGTRETIEIEVTWKPRS